MVTLEPVDIEVDVIDLERIDDAFIGTLMLLCCMAINVAIENNVNWCIMCESRMLKYPIILFRSGVGLS